MDETWTLMAFKEHIEKILAERDLRFMQRVDDVNKAIRESNVAAETNRKIAYDAMDKRLDGMNGFRQSLTDQSRTFVPRVEHEILIRGIDERMGDIRDRIEKIRNLKEGGNAVWAYVMSAVGVLIALGAILLK